MNRDALEGLPDVLSVRDLQALLQIERSQAYQLIRDNRVKHILTVVRPKHDREEEEDMDKEQALKIIREYEEAKKTKEPNPDWGEKTRKWALESGLIAGDEKGRPQWEAAVTRNQLVTILYKFFRLVQKIIRRE